MSCRKKIEKFWKSQSFLNVMRNCEHKSMKVSYRCRLRVARQLPQLRWRRPAGCRTTSATRPSVLRRVPSIVDLKIEKKILNHWTMMESDAILPISIESLSFSVMEMTPLEKLCHCSLSGRTSFNQPRSGSPSRHSSYFCKVEEEKLLKPRF